MAWSNECKPISRTRTEQASTSVHRVESYSWTFVVDSAGDFHSTRVPRCFLRCTCLGLIKSGLSEWKRERERDVDSIGSLHFGSIASVDRDRSHLCVQHHRAHRDRDRFHVNSRACNGSHSLYHHRQIDLCLLDSSHSFVMNSAIARYNRAWLRWFI